MIMARALALAVAARKTISTAAAVTTMQLQNKRIVRRERRELFGGERSAATTAVLTVLATTIFIPTQPAMENARIRRCLYKTKTEITFRPTVESYSARSAYERKVLQLQRETISTAAAATTMQPQKKREKSVKCGESCLEEKARR